MDLQERRQLDVAERVQRVKARARPWRSIIALAIAVAGAIAARGWGVASYALLRSARIDHTAKIIFVTGSLTFFVFGMIAAIGLSGAARRALEPLIGQAHAGVVRYVLLVAGIFTVLVVALTVLGISPRQLIVGGAVTGVLIGIAAQQSLSNVFAGLVLLFARPFRVGQRVRFRAGALSGQIEGIVIDLSLTYVRLDSEDGIVLLPNSQVLASAVLLVPDRPEAIEPSAGS